MSEEIKPKGFIFLLSFREIVDALPPEDLKDVISALMDLVEDGSEPEKDLSPIAKIAFISMKKDVLQTIELWKEAQKKLERWKEKRNER